VETVEISSGDIRLGQLLKLHGVAEHGVMAKDMIASGDVLVNGEVDTRRSAKIVTGDVISVPAAGVEFTVAQALEPPAVS